MLIRPAEEKDIEQILNIYNYEVLHGVSTFDIHPKTIEEWKIWYFQHTTDKYLLLVAVINDQVAGYASLSRYREKEAYDSTVELSVYVSPAFRQQSVATQLMEHIIEKARNNEDIHLVVSVITGGNAVSTHLHERFGFTHCGTIHEAGIKFGDFLDIDNYELIV